MTRKLLVAICTHLKGQEALQLARQVVALPIDDGWEVNAVIVENQPLPRLDPDLIAHKAIHHAHEPAVGLSNARNKALDMAIALNADWIGFFDDDQVLHSDWLSVFSQDARDDDVDLLYGPALPQTSAATNKLIRTKNKPAFGTGNAFVHARLFHPRHLGLRFDPRFNLTGGEDSYFYRAAKRAGATIRFNPHLQVTTPIDPARRRPLQRLYRYLCGGAIRSTMLRYERNYAALYIGMPQVALILVGSGLVWFVKEALFRRSISVLSGLFELTLVLSHAFGMLLGLFGIRFYYYRNYRGE